MGYVEKPKHRDTWIRHYNELLEFIKVNHRLPSNSNGKYEERLKAWLHNNRVRYRQGKLESDRMEALIKIHPNILVASNLTEISDEIKRGFYTKATDKTDLPLGDLSIEQLEVLNKHGIYSVEDFISKLREELKCDEYDQSEFLVDMMTGDTKHAPIIDNIKIQIAVIKHLDKTAITDRDAVLVARFIPLLVGGYSYRFYKELLNPRLLVNGLCNRIKYMLIPENAKLTEREASTMIQRVYFGMYLNDIGKVFSVTTERVRQIEAKAFRRLRHPVRKDFILFDIAKYNQEKAAFELEKKSWEESKRLGINRSKLHVPLDELELSLRSYNCLRRAGFDCLNDIITKAGSSKREDVEAVLLKVRNLGIKSTAEVLDIIFNTSTVIRGVANKSVEEIFAMGYRPKHVMVSNEALLSSRQEFDTLAAEIYEKCNNVLKGKYSK